jgi:molecular chaperone DnaK
MLVGDAQEAVQQEAPTDRARSLISELQQILQGLLSRVGVTADAGGRAATGSAATGTQDRGPAADEDVIDAEFDRS